MPLGPRDPVTRYDGPVGAMSGRGHLHSAVVPLRLNLPHDLQHVPEALVVDDGALIDRAQFIVDGVGDRRAGDTQFDATIRKLEDLDIFTNQPAVRCGVGQKVELAFVV